MVVEENRISSNSTGSNVRVSSNSTGSSNSHVNEMELMKVSPLGENINVEIDTNVEAVPGGELQPLVTIAGLEDSESSGQCVSVLSNEDNCASGLMLGVEHDDRTPDTPSNTDTPPGKSISKPGGEELKQTDKAVIEEQTISCTEETKVSDGAIIYVRNENNVNLVTDISVYSKGECSAEKDNDPHEIALENECYEGISEYIPRDNWKTPLTCFSYNTVRDISYRLDSVDEAHDGQLSKDYIGLCDRINLDPAFTKYLVKSHIKLKTEEVLCKWEVLPVGSGPRPTVGNFCKIVYVDLDRPDVIDDLHEDIVHDAEKWEATKKEAKTDKPDEEDNSWQLTRHDVATGMKTFYTACLCYADEDEGMATLITNFFQAVWKDTRFFRPQFDLKMGKYVCDTTAKVIEERCNGKVIFILSDYFYASEVCQFAVNFAHQVDAAAEQGNLIPFYLTNKYQSAPKVLKGIAGVRWARKQFRYHSWGQLTDCLIAKPDQSNKSEVSEIQERIKGELEHSSPLWLCEPPYDEDTPAPGPALPLNEPPDDSINSSACFDPDGDDNSPMVDSDQTKSSKKPLYRRFFNRVRTMLPNSRRTSRRRPPIRAEELNRAFQQQDCGPSAVV